MSGWSHSSTGRSVTVRPWITRPLSLRPRAHGVAADGDLPLQHLPVHRQDLLRGRFPGEPERHGNRGPAHPPRHPGVAEELKHPLGMVAGVVPLHQEARHAVGDDVAEPADGGCDGRGPAGLRLQGHQAEGLGARRDQHGFGGGVEVGQPALRLRGEEHDPLAHPESGGQLHEPAHLDTVAGSARPSYHGEHHVDGAPWVASHRLGQGADRDVRPLVRLEPAHEQQQANPRQVQPGLGLVLRPGEEELVIDPRRNQADASWVGRVQPDQLGRLGGGRGHDPVGVTDDGLLPGQAGRRLRALPRGKRRVLHLSQGVERRHQRDSPDLLGAPSHPSRQPVVGVDQVVARRLGFLAAQDATEELTKEPGELLLGYGGAWTRLDLDYPRPRCELLDVGPAPPLASGEDVNAYSPCRKGIGRRPDIDVHPARVTRARLIEGRGVQADEGHTGPCRRRRNSATTSPTRAPPPLTGRRANPFSSPSSASESAPISARARMSAGPDARSPPSATFTATPRPACGTVAQASPSAPDFTTRSAEPSMTAVSVRFLPATMYGWARIAAEHSAIRSPRAPKGCGLPSRAYSAAIRKSGIPWTGTPQPSTPTAMSSRPVRPRTAREILRWRGWVAERYPSRSQPRRSQPATIPACLPEQLWRTLRGLPALAMDRGSSGHPGGLRRADSPRPAARSRRRTVATWTGSPLCEAHITATRSSPRPPPIAPSETAAWTGFMHERANTVRWESPAHATRCPSTSHTATCPRWTDSSSPERKTRTRTVQAAVSLGAIGG